MVIIKHNIDVARFDYAWAWYVKGGIPTEHCQRCLKGERSKKFSKATLLASPRTVITMDELPEGSYKAIYFCCGDNHGYAHNVHIPVIPAEGRSDTFDFDGWHVEIHGGYIDRMPTEEEIPEEYFHDPYGRDFYTCRNFRWMLGHFFPERLRPTPPQIP